MDYTGMRFGKLTVLEFSHRKGGYSYYLCQCDCGDKIIRKMVSLKNPGCHMCDACIEIMRKSCKGRPPTTQTYNGETHTLREWSEIMGIPLRRLKSRYAHKYAANLIFYPGKITKSVKEELMEL